jgi:hypothetical protein
MNETCTFRSILLLILYFVFPLVTSAQTDLKNSVYGEINGNREWTTYSINYERMVSKQVPLRIGICFFSQTVGVTMHAGKIFGRGSNYFECSAGIIYGNTRAEGPVETTTFHTLAGSAFIGYRRQFFQDRFLGRVGYTPAFGSFLSHSAALSLGYRF